MRGWLVVNHFVYSEKFKEIYAMLCASAKGCGAELAIKTPGELLCDTESDFPSPLPDFVLFWDKDIYLARRLELAGVRVFNSSRAIEHCDNKLLTAIDLTGRVRTPGTILAPRTFEGVGYNRTDFLERAADMLGLPFVLKEAHGSFGRQVYLIDTLDTAKRILGTLGYKEFLMQEFVASSRGRDLRVNVVGERAVSAMLRFNKDDFRSNVSIGGQTARYTLTAEQEAAAVTACRAVGADFAGVDLLFGGDGEPIVCEVNSNPHFKSTYLCTGSDMSRDILRYVLDAAGSRA